MAQQYDGAVKINTNIDPAGFYRGSKELEQATARLQKKFEALGAGLQRALNNYRKAVASGNADRIQDMSEKLKQAKNAAKEFEKQIIRFGITQFKTDNYQEIEKALSKANAALESLYNRQERMEALGVKETSNAYKGLQYDIKSAEEEVARLEKALEDSEGNGGIFEGKDTAQFKSYIKGLERVSSFGNIAGAVGKLAEVAGKAAANFLKMTAGTILAGLREIGKDTAEAARNLTSMTAKAVTSGIRRLGAWLSNAAKSMTLFGRSAKSAHGGLKRGFMSILKYTLGIRSLYILFNRLRAAIKEGFGNLAQYSDETNKSLSAVISAFTRLKNAIAATFAPIVNTVDPALANLTNGLSNAATSLGAFIAALSGQKTFIRAKEVQQDYAESLDKTKKAARETKRQLASFDQLNILSDDKEETGLNPDDMFETVPIEGAAKDFAEIFKEAWENIDLTGVGDKIKSALDGIPWKKLKTGAAHTGKRMATFLNGLINVPELGRSLGNAIARAINTAFAFVDGFAWNFNWPGLGDAIMDTIEAACIGLDWNLINNALRGVARGFADLLNAVFARQSVFKTVGVTIGNGINAAVNAGITFLERFDFVQAARSIVGGLNAAVAEIEWDKIGRLIGDAFGGALRFIYTAITEFNWTNLASGFADGLNTFVATAREKIKNLNPAEIGAAFGQFINDCVSGVEWDELGALVGDFIGGAFTAAAAFIRALKPGEIITAIQDFFTNAIQEIDWNDVLTVWGVAALTLALKNIILAHPILSILIGAALALGPELGAAVSNTKIL